MSAPDTNIEKQTRRHIGPLTGIAVSLAFVGVLYLGYLMILAERGQTPEVAGEDTLTAPGIVVQSN